MKEITHFMNLRNINTQLQMKTRRYIEYMHHEEKNGSQKGENLLNTLAPLIKEEIKNDAYFKILNEIQFFKNKFSNDFLFDLCSVVKESTYAPEQLIFKKVIIKILLFT